MKFTSNNNLKLIKITEGKKGGFYHTFVDEETYEKMDFYSKFPVGAEGNRYILTIRKAEYNGKVFYALDNVQNG